MRLTPELQDRFDNLLKDTLDELPAELLKLFDEIPLVVEDYPSEKMLARLGISRPELLRGLHTGVPLTRRSVRHSGVLPTVITIYRLGICNVASDRRGEISDVDLAREIRKTVLHELGHYFGLGEEELRKYGYG